MKSRLPVILMLTVLAAPFIASLILLADKDSINDNAKGEWLTKAEYVLVNQQAPWQLLWREQDCTNNCDAWFGLLQRVKMALGKYSEKLTISEINNDKLLTHENGLFIADHQGLVLLSYEANQDGAYNLLKDLKVLMKHGGA